MTDPCDDKNYKGLGLKDFLRHFVPQVDTQIAEIQNANTIGFNPLIDLDIEKDKPLPPAKNRAERRQREKEQKKKDKKKK